MYLSAILPLRRPVHPPAIHLTYVGRRIKPARERYKLFQDRNEDRFDVVFDPNRDLRASGERSKASFTLADVIDQLYELLDKYSIGIGQSRRYFPRNRLIDNIRQRFFHVFPNLSIHRINLRILN